MQSSKFNQMLIKDQRQIIYNHPDKVKIATQYVSNIIISQQVLM